MDSKFDIKFGALAYGWGGIEFCSSQGESHYLDFDECLSDPYPNLVRTYLKVKAHANFCWGTSSRDGIVITIKNIDDNTIEVKLDMDLYYEEKEVTFVEQVNRQRFLDILDKLFKDFLACPDFPQDYPCHDMSDDTEYNRCWDLENQYMEEHPDVDDYDAHKIIFREHFKLTDEAKEFAAIFRNMLENYDVPTNWCISEIRGID